MSQYNIFSAGEGQRTPTNEAGNPDEGSPTHGHHNGEDMFLWQPQQDDTSGDGRDPQPQPESVALGFPLNIPGLQSRMSTPELPESGPEHDEGVTESRSIMQAMQDKPGQRDSLLDAMAVSNAYLPGPDTRPANPGVPAAAILPGPPAWQDITPDWIPGQHPYPAVRPQPWHGRTNGYSVSARDSASPRTALERLEMFRALYPSLHFVLKQTPNQGLDIDLTLTYKAVLAGLRRELLEAREKRFPNDASQHNTEGLPQIGEGWTDYVEDWDVAGHSKVIKNRILSNWDHPAREAWKVQRCPILLDPTWVADPTSGEFIDANQELWQRGLPKCVGVVVRNDGRLYIEGMRHTFNTP